MLVLVDVDVDHRGLVGTFLSHSVNDIVSEVELILILKVHRTEYTLLAGLALDESLGNGVQQTCLVDISEVMFSDMLLIFGHSRRTSRSSNESVNLAVLAAECDLVMRERAVVIDAVALMEYFGMRTDSDTHSPL